MFHSPILLLVFLSIVAIAGCSKTADGKKSSDAPGKSNSEAEGKPANALCALYTTSEVSKWLGTPVKKGEAAGPLGSACQWDGIDDEEASLQIQMVEARYWEEPKLDPKYEALTGIAAKAFVAPRLRGWYAGAQTENQPFKCRLAEDHPIVTLPSHYCEMS